MIINLFSIFDPSTRIFNFSLNWLRILLGIFIIPIYYWIIPNNFLLFYYKILNILFKEFKPITKNNKSSLLIFISLFIFILIRNFIRLFPYIFTRTRHLVLNLTIALLIWISFIILGWI